VIALDKFYDEKILYDIDDVFFVGDDKMDRKVDVIVIGGSAAGLTAAITCRRHYPEKHVLIIRSEKKVLIPCGIPYIFGTVGSPDKNLIPDAIPEKNGIEIIVDSVENIDRGKRIVATESGKEIGYEKLVLATGSVPIKPSIPGVDKENIFLVKKDIPYLSKMHEQLDRSSDLVIVGGGYIGTEFADECRKNRKINITIVEMLSHCLAGALDEDYSSVVDSTEKDLGINILASEKVESFTGNGKVEGVKLVSGSVIKADMVILGIGAVANTALAEKAGLPLGQTRGIQVNRYMQTRDENIYACGDCAEKISFFNGKPSNLKLASNATREARIAGANLFKTQRTNEGVIGVFSTKLGNTAFALAGLSERGARQKGFDIVTGQAEAPNRHPGGMPGMAPMKVKLVFERGTGRILGGEALGADCCGELINAISVCIHEKMTIDDIAVFPMGTHPALTASPLVYQLTNAAEMAAGELRK